MQLVPTYDTTPVYFYCQQVELYTLKQISMGWVAVITIILGSYLGSMFPPINFTSRAWSIIFLCIRIIGWLIALAATCYLCSIVHKWIGTNIY